MDPFLQQEYCVDHMKLDDECIWHYYHFGLNVPSKNCDKNYNGNICCQNLQEFHLFKETDRFLEHIFQQVSVAEAN